MVILAFLGGLVTGLLMGWLGLACLTSAILKRRQKALRQVTVDRTG